MASNKPKKPAKAPAAPPATKPPAQVKPKVIKLKPLDWSLCDARKVVSKWPEDVKTKIGKELFKVEIGEAPTPGSVEYMADIGPGAYEVKAQDANGWFRVFYVTKFSDATYVLHAIQKKTNATPQEAIDLAKERYKLAVKKNHAKAAALKAAAKTAKKGK